MNFYRLTIGDKEFRLKLTTAAKIEAEKLLGFSLLNAVEKLEFTKTFAVILWASLQKYHSAYTLKKTYDLIDELEEEGCSLDRKVDITLEIMKVSGFFTKAQIAEMEKADNEEAAEE